ncbi:MAG TPA: hypothetical protein VGY66_27120 [Gemmataceae bacterium]|nr:hypothetical protein [Gemmataceae bacterium]
MAKQCTACSRLYQEQQDSCPHCGAAGDSVKLPAPRIGGEYAEDLTGRARAAGWRHAAALAQPLAETRPVYANSGRLPASHAPLEIMAAAELPADPHPERSPLSPPAKEDHSSRVEINEADIEVDSIGELAVQGGRDFPTAREQASAVNPSSDSEFDLRLVWNDEEEPPPGPDQWEGEKPSSSPHSGEDFGVHLVENIGGAAGSGADHAGDAAISGSQPPGVASDSHATENPSAPQEPAAELPLTSASSPEIELPPDAPGENPYGATEKVLPGADAMASDDEIDTSLYPSPLVPYAPPEPVPIEQALPWFSPGPSKPASESTRLSNTLLGVLIGAGVCFALWLFGLQPPSSWQLKHAAKADSTAREAVGAVDSKAPSYEETEAKLFADDWAVEFVTAVDLARARQYPAALEVLNGLCAMLEERRFLNLADGTDSPEAEQALLKTSYELLSAWQFEHNLAKKGMLAQSRNTAGAVDNLLADNKRLQATLEALNAKLKAAGSGSDSVSLADKIEGLLKSRADAEKQVGLLPVERQRAARAEESAQAALARAVALEDKLKATELKWQKSESKVNELKAKQEAVAKAKPLVMPPLKLTAPVHDAKLAYQHYAKGLGLYRTALYAEAEQEFDAAVQADDQDARYHYYQGLARWAQGKHEQAATSFRAGAHMERDNKPSRIFVKVALDHVDLATLKEVNRYRPE